MNEKNFHGFLKAITSTIQNTCLVNLKNALKVKTILRKKDLEIQSTNIYIHKEPQKPCNCRIDGQIGS